jgi:hypothetical protein
MRTFDALLRQRTPQDFKTQTLTALAGLGAVLQRGLGAGTLTLSGTPTESYSLAVRVTTAGVLGTAAVQVSTDGGANYGTAATVPSNGLLPTVYFGVVLLFANSEDVGQPSFAVGDVFTAEVSAIRFPATSWHAGSVPLKLVEGDSDALSEMEALSVAVAAGGFLETADPGLPETSPAGPWLRMHAAGVYGLTWRAGVLAQGQVVLTDAASQGPFVIQPGQLVVASTGGRLYRNSSGGTLAQGNTLTLTFTAEDVGVSYNVPNGAVTQLLTVLPGVTVSNPAVGGSGTWLTRQGTNPETQGELRNRCRSRWPTLGTGGPPGGYEFWATEASAEVTRVHVAASTTLAGAVNVYLAGPAGPVSSGAVEDVQEYLEQVSPTTVVPVALSATALSVVLVGTVRVPAAQLSGAKAVAEANLAALFAALPVGGDKRGGTPGILDREALVAAIRPQDALGRSTTGVLDLDMSLPAGDIVLGAAQVAILANGLTWTAV